MMRDQWNHADGSTVSQRRFCNSVQRCFKAENRQFSAITSATDQEVGHNSWAGERPEVLWRFPDSGSSLAGLACNEGGANWLSSEKQR